MTDQPHVTATRPPLVRPRHGRMVLGVCAGLGRATDIDPVVYRVIAVVLTIFGGLGVLIYGLGWLLIPEEGSELSEAERILRRHRHRLHPRTLVILAGVVAVIWLASVVRGGHNLAVSVILVALLGYLLLRDRGGVLAPPAPPTMPTMPAATPVAEPEPPAATDAAPAPQPPAPPTPPPPPPLRPRSRLGWITMSVALVVVGALVAAREAGVGGLSATHILAATVLVFGIGLVVGSVIGRARWLVLPGGALAVATLSLVGIGVPVDGGIGDRTWHPTTVLARDYHLGVGHATLDLRDAPIDSSGPTYIDASVAIGQLEVLVPPDVTVWNTDARTAVGHVDVFGQERSGLHPHLNVGAPVGQSQGLVLRLRVGAGDVEVRHVAW